MKLLPIKSAPKDGNDIILFRFIEGAVEETGICYYVKSFDFWQASTDAFFSPTHWCSLPTLEDDAETPIQLSQTHINALTKDLAKKRDEIESLTAELQAVKAELNERLHERTQAFLAKEIRITKERDSLRKRIAKNRPGPNGLLAINQDEYDAMFSVDGRAE